MGNEKIERQYAHITFSPEKLEVTAKPDYNPPAEQLDILADKWVLAVEQHEADFRHWHLAIWFKTEWMGKTQESFRKIMKGFFMKDGSEWPVSYSSNRALRIQFSAKKDKGWTHIVAYVRKCGAFLSNGLSAEEDASSKLISEKLTAEKRQTRGYSMCGARDYWPEVVGLLRECPEVTTVAQVRKCLLEQGYFFFGNWPNMGSIIEDALAKRAFDRRDGENGREGDICNQDVPRKKRKTLAETETHT